MDVKLILTWVSVTAVIVMVVFGIAQMQKSANMVGDGSNRDILTAIPTDKVKWAPIGTAAVTLVEYSDFQCPACGGVAQAIASLDDEFMQSITFVYRHFPLRNIHQFADLSARAAEAAGVQGKFWEMHDKLFANAVVWSTASNETEVQNIFVEYAQELELDVVQFEEYLTNPEIIALVKVHEKQARELKLSGAPSFFLNGRVFDMPHTVDALRNALQKAVAEAEGEVNR